MSMERTWGISSGEVRLGGMAPDTPKLALRIRSRSFTSLMFHTIMT